MNDSNYLVDKKKYLFLNLTSFVFSLWMFLKNNECVQNCRKN